MKPEISKLKTLIEQSKTILVVSHFSPDPDAISSTIFTKNILQKNYPDKKIEANIEDALLDSFSIIVNPKEITTKKLIEKIDEISPDLIICLDLPAIKLTTRDETSNLVSKIKEKQIEIVIIDHHERSEVGIDALYINYQDNACAETAYQVFHKELDLKNYTGYANHLLLGINGDTGSFSFLERNPSKTLQTTAAILEDGGSLDLVKLATARIQQNQIPIYIELLKNITCNGEYTYSYISDEFFRENKQFSLAEYSTINKIFVIRYLKSIGDAYWGFTLKPGLEKQYKISFRSLMGYIDTTVFTTKLNGGGHKASSGGIVFADTVNEAISKVIEVIEKYKEEAYEKGKDY